MVTRVSHLGVMRYVMTILLISTLALAGGGRRNHRLFHIDRSKDIDIVVYDAVTDGNQLAEDDPVDVYWILKQKGGQRDDLNWIERWKGYGIDVDQRWGKDSLEFVMRADGTKIRVTRRNGEWIGMTRINDQLARLESIYVKTDESGWFPEVLEVHMKGYRLSDGVRVVEVIRPD